MNLVIKLFIICYIDYLHLKQTHDFPESKTGAGIFSHFRWNHCSHCSHSAIIKLVSLDFQYGMRHVQYNVKMDEKFLHREILFLIDGNSSIVLFSSHFTKCFLKTKCYRLWLQDLHQRQALLQMQW